MAAIMLTSLRIGSPAAPASRLLRAALAAGLLAGALVSTASGGNREGGTPANAPDTELSGLHDFDFEIGEWRVHHRVKRPIDAPQWMEFDGICRTSWLMDGRGNVEDHTFDKPAGVTRGVALRAYDPKTAQWAIWWIDGRDPHGALDPPVKGGFERGVGTFYSDGLVDGKPVRTRFIWSHITPTSAHWEQAYSWDAGKTWQANWTMDFRRMSK